MTTASVKREDPPIKEVRYDWQAIAKKLRRKPGEWHVIFEQDRSSLVVAIRSNHISALRPEAGFEAQTSNNKQPTEAKPYRTCKLYMRYNPEKEVK